MALLIKIDESGNSLEVVEPKGGTFSLKELHDFVGGYLRIVFVALGELCFVLNREGKITHLPTNDIATMLYRAIGPRLFSDEIVGNVLLCKSNEIE